MDDNIIDGLHDAGCSEDLIELYSSPPATARVFVY